MMGRIRTIKPEYFTSKDIVKLEPIARLVYIALWCEADQTYFVDFARALESDLRETLRRHVDWSDEGGRDGVA